MDLGRDWALMEGMMTADEIEEIKYLLKNASPDWCVYSEPDVGLSPSLFSGNPGTDDFSLIEPLQFHDLSLAALAPSLARRVIAAEKLVEAAKEIERWWLEDEMKNHMGAPVGMFMIRSSITEYEATK